MSLYKKAKVFLNFALLDAYVVFCHLALRLSINKKTLI